MKCRIPFVRGLGLTLAAALLGGCAAARAQTPADGRKKLVLLIAARSYETDRTLPAFAAQFLAGEFRVVVVSGAMTNERQSFDRIEELAEADLLLVSVWRRTPPRAQLAALQRYLESGRPVVGIATSSHSFARRTGMTLGPEQADWPEWDARVIGGNYTGHHPSGLITAVTALDAAHPILTGVRLPFSSKMELNKVSPLQAGAHPLLLGTLEGRPPEPVAWTFRHYGGGRTFFTPLGLPDDFAQPAFQRLFLNGIRWAAGLPLEAATSRK